MSGSMTLKEIPGRLSEREHKTLRGSDTLVRYLERNGASLHCLQQELSARKLPRSTIARILRLPESLLKTCK